MSVDVHIFVMMGTKLKNPNDVLIGQVNALLDLDIDKFSMCDIILDCMSGNYIYFGKILDSCRCSDGEWDIDFTLNMMDDRCHPIVGFESVNRLLKYKEADFLNKYDMFKTQLHVFSHYS